MLKFYNNLIIRLFSNNTTKINVLFNAKPIYVGACNYIITIPEYKIEKCKNYIQIQNSWYNVSFMLLLYRIRTSKRKYHIDIMRDRLYYDINTLINNKLEVKLNNYINYLLYSLEIDNYDHLYGCDSIISDYFIKNSNIFNNYN